MTCTGPFGCASLGSPGPQRAQKAPPERFDRIHQAVLFDHRLWIASDSKEVWAVEETTNQINGWEFRDRVSSLLRTGNRLLATTASAEGERVLWERRGEDWRQVRAWRHEKRPRWLTMAADGDQLVLAESTRAQVIDRDGREREVTFTQAIPGGHHVSAALTSGALYVGLDSGEFGGGLWRVDLSTGSMTEVRGSGLQPPPPDDPLCGPSLYHECAPVTAVVADPARPGCVLASVGMSHMGSTHGAVHRVCGEAIERLWYEQLRDRGSPWTGYSDSAAVWGLLPAPGGFWAATNHGLVRREAGRADQVWTTLAIETLGGVTQSRQLAGVRLVWSAHQAAVSVGGGGAMLVPTE